MMRVGPLARAVVSPLQFLMLLQLNYGSRYGYEMLKDLRDEFEGVWNPRTGTFYPALRSLEARGFVETETKEETEFYNLTEKGMNLLGSLGERLERDYEFMDRYFRALVKWMPRQTRKRLIGIMRSLSERDVDVYSPMQQFLDETVDRETKLNILEGMIKILRTRLEVAERLKKEITDGDGE
ncbi:MAG: PadR family transcriptional regulator [Candidatus Bathyarchaeota archaeon]|jgi:DNA-binding PadR family transcriptional regulator|nr:PadR family transcriptional regulator [Candidatus Bathyarchaeota archaeon]